MRAAEQPVADRGNGNRTIPLIGPGSGASQFVNGLTDVAPGQAIREHHHNCEETILILEGEAIAVLDGVEYPLKAPDASWVAPGVRHYFRNSSATERLRIFWVYASPEATRTDTETGETRTIAAEHRKLVTT